jgi:hypothetical protein
MGVCELTDFPALTERLRAVNKELLKSSVMVVEQHWPSRRNGSCAGVASAGGGCFRQMLDEPGNGDGIENAEMRRPGGRKGQEGEFAFQGASHGRCALLPL